MMMKPIMMIQQPPYGSDADIDLERSDDDEIELKCLADGILVFECARLLFTDMTKICKIKVHKQENQL